MCKRGNHTYPFLEMEVGDSFALFLPRKDESKAKLRNKLYCAIKHCKAAYDIHCITRTVTEEGRKKVRVWRMQ